MAIKAFPSAEGYGKNTIGGRGGRIILVTNLNDSGSGSFREACEASGARNVIFMVSGRINVLTTIHISNPFITIWGGSAPGDGICLSTEYPLKLKTMGIITHEVIIRFIKFRRSVTKADHGGDSDCLWIGVGYNIIIDHCSLAWSSDGNLDITNYRSQGGGTLESNSTRNITVSNCLIGPNLGDKTKSILAARTTKITFFRNFFINSLTRNPAFNNPNDDGVKFDQFHELANNFHYNYLDGTTYNCNDPSTDNGTFHLNLLNNKGLKYTSYDGSKILLTPTYPSLAINHRRYFTLGDDPNLKAIIYGKGNITPWRHDNTLDEFEFGQFGEVLPQDNDKPIPLINRSATPIPTPLITDNVELLEADDVFDTLKGTVGAYYPTRDAEDERAINDVEQGIVTVSAGFIPTFPTYGNGTPKLDSNDDGIPDDWESLNMPIGDNYNDISPSGYTWLEAYQFSLIGEEIPLKAFHTAEGFGKYATGGRGGVIIKVTNLNNSGVGSLREALQYTSGARIIVFEVGGIINLTSPISVTNGDVTVAFQTALGDGILLTGSEISLESSNIIIRYLRSRPTDNATENNGDGISIVTWGGIDIENIIIDHASISWSHGSQSKNVNIRTLNPLEGGGGTTDGSIKNITIQNSIISESLYAYLGFGNTFNKTIYRNLFAFNSQRNIRTNYPTDDTFDFEMINNLIYGCGSGTGISYGSKFSIINNHFKESSEQQLYEHIVDATPSGQGNPSQTHAYITGNIVPTRYDEYNKSRLETYIRPTPYKTSNIIPLPSTEVEDDIKYAVGASLPLRDSIDSGIIDKINNNTGAVTLTGIVPTMNGGTPLVDTNNDGIPDDWTAANMPLGATHNDIAPSGYTWIEEYINKADIPELINSLYPLSEVQRRNGRTTIIKLLKSGCL